MAEAQPIFFAKTDDPGMNEAFEKAKQNFRYFWRELSWEPVSYTHLDVYKRQLYGR